MILYRRSITALLVVALSLTVATFTSAAAAKVAPRTLAFCKAYSAIPAVPVLSLPAGTSISDIKSAVNLVPGDVSTLAVIRTKLLDATRTSPVPAIANALRAAASSSASESTALVKVPTDVNTLLLDPTNYSDMEALTKDVSSADYAAGATTAILALYRPTLVRFCAGK
jgi:hypothetical protein